MKYLFIIGLLFLSILSFGQYQYYGRSGPGGTNSFRQLQTADIPNLSSIYQPLLISGTNIKTVNGISVLGSGDITVSGGVPSTRAINTTSPLAGGGDLSADRTFTIANAAADGSTKGAASFLANDFDATTGNISIDYTNGQTASGSLKGFLSSTDWTIFNTKQAALVSGTNIKTVNGNTLLGSGDVSISASASLSSLTAASGSNTIDNVANQQTWNWNSLAGGTAFAIQANTTAAASSTQTMFFADLFGANSTSGQTTWASIIRNRHTGSTSTNKVLELVGSGSVTTQGLIVGVTGTTTTTGITISASGATNNYALLTTGGNVGIGSAAPTRKLTLDDATTGSLFSIARNATERLLIGIAGASDGIATGSLTDDVIFRGSSGQKMIFSSDGTSSDVALNAKSLGIGTISPTSKLTVNGSFGAAYVAKTALYTLTASDYLVEVTSGTHTQTLPTAVGISGRIYIVTNSGSGVVTLGTTSSQTFVNVSGTPTTLTINQFGSVTVQSNGANWLATSIR